MFFGREIYKGIVKLNDAFIEQINLKNDINKFKESAKPKNLDKRESIGLTFEKHKYTT